MDKIKLKYANKTFLPNSLIQEAIDNGWERSLAYFIILQQAYKYPIFYNYSLRKISSKTGISISVLSRHIKTLTEKGLIFTSGNNLCLIGLNRLKIIYKVKGKLVPIKLSNNISELILNIQYTRYIPNFKNQQRIVEKKTEVIKFRKSVVSYRKGAKQLLNLQYKIYGNQVPSEKSINNYLMLSNSSFGRLAKRSKYTGKNIQKRLNKAGLIKSERNSILVSNKPCDRRSFYEQCLTSEYLHSKVKGYIYRSMPNRIEILTK